MNKHLSAIVFTFLAFWCFSSRVMAYDATETLVSTYTEFMYALSQSATANIRLTADIDLSKVSSDYAYLCNYTFKGRISGKTTGNGGFNYALKNGSKTLFAALEGATIEHLVISNCTFDGRDVSSGWLADDSKSTTFNDIIFSNVQGTGDDDGLDCDRMGAATGTADGCTFTNLFFMGCKLLIDGAELGMVAGNAKDCTFTSCVSNLYCDLWADGNTYGLLSNAYVGGICGYADHCTLTTCYNFGVVSSDDDRTGGIIGYGTNGTSLTDCQNAGVVSHCTKSGFGRAKREQVADVFYKISIVSTLAATATASFICSETLETFAKAHTDNFFWYSFDSAHDIVTNVTQGSLYSWTDWEGVASNLMAALPIVFTAVSAVTGGIYLSISLYNATTNPDEIGGIAGKIDNSSTVLRCTNEGPVNGADEDCGGIVGHLEDSSIESCYNRTFVTGGFTMTTGKDVGGIVGYCKNGTINGNLNVGTVTAATSRIGNIDGYRTGTFSGSNNYYLAEANATNATTVAFTQEALPSGSVATALNKALTDAGKSAIWRQDLGVGKDFYPVILNNKKPIVTATTSDYSLVQNISTASDFYLAVANPNAQISLQNDIDLRNYYFNCSSETYPFKGIINGNGHTIYNASYEAANTTEPAHHYKAFFPYATKATFRNLTINNFHITQKVNTLSEVDYLALLVAVSNGCTYDNVTLSNSSIPLNSDNDYQRWIAGLVASSTGDTFTDCTVDGTCSIQGYTGNSLKDAYVGGIAAIANGSTFTRCYNAAAIFSDDDKDGGIVGYAEGCTLTGCLNTGTITAQCYVGGIAGHVKSTTITQCVNTGTIKDDSSTKENYRAGIVGLMETSGSISDCLNFGEVEYPGSSSGAIDGSHEGITYGDGNDYYCKYDGSKFTNMSDALYAQMTSGAYAYSKNWLYQSIDNQAFSTNLPVPIPAAGTVYSNVLCDDSETQSYSNRYHAASGHATSDIVGICSACGRITCASDNVPTQVYITNASELQELAYAVSKGVNYSNSVIRLSNDIDMAGVTDYFPIGTDRDHPFRGYFTGQGHRIKNLTLKQTEAKEGTGIFGCVSGTNASGTNGTTYITDLVVDKTCTISSNGGGVAGIVGAVTTPTGATAGANVCIERCGNEATIVGNNINAAGLLGAVYYNDASSIDIEDCYNTGAIYGAKESAALVGYGRKLLTVKRCWNAGSVSGFDTNHSMIRYAAVDGSTNQVFEDIYQYSGLDADSKAISKTYADFAYGTLCNLLNTQATSVDKPWSQNLGTDVTPQLANSVGIYHQRDVSSTWGTVVLPYALSSDDDVQLYEVESCDVSSTEGKLTLKPVTTVAANTPCFFKKLGESAASVCFSKGDNELTLANGDPESITVPTGLTGWSMVGSYDALSELKDVYYLAQDKLWRAEEAITLPAYRAYMTYTGSGCKSLSLQVLDEDGDVDEIVNINANGTEGPCYNLAGQRVKATTRGIVIQNGIKYLRK